MLHRLEAPGEPGPSPSCPPGYLQSGPEESLNKSPIRAEIGWEEPLSLPPERPCANIQEYDRDPLAVSTLSGHTLVEPRLAWPCCQRCPDVRPGGTPGRRIEELKAHLHILQTTQRSGSSSALGVDREEGSGEAKEGAGRAMLPNSSLSRENRQRGWINKNERASCEKPSLEVREATQGRAGLLEERQIKRKMGNFHVLLTSRPAGRQQFQDAAGQTGTLLLARGVVKPFPGERVIPRKTELHRNLQGQ